MFKGDIKKIYVKNHIKKIYFVKRHNENSSIEEKNSSILYKNFDDFVAILVNIRKFDKNIKKLKVDKRSSEFSNILLKYLSFHVHKFGYKFHSFILEYTKDLADFDINNCYVINEISKTDIQNVVKNGYSRILFKYDSVKNLLHYIKRHIIIFDTFNANIQQLLTRYLYVSLNPLNLLIFVYLKIYNNGAINGTINDDTNGAINTNKAIVQNNNKISNGELVICSVKSAGKHTPVSWKDGVPLQNIMNDVAKIFERDNFFCNDLYFFLCTYAEYIMKYTIISCYGEIYNDNEVIKGKLKIFQWSKRSIRSCVMQKIRLYGTLKNLKLTDKINIKYTFNSYEMNVIQYIKNFKRFTEVGNGFKNIKMSHRNYSYIYELVLLLYFIKKCLYHLNDNVDFVLQVSLYTIYKTIKVTIIYLYFNLPKYMNHYFLNIFLIFFKNKTKKVSATMNKMKRTYRNVMNNVSKQRINYMRKKLFNCAKVNKQNDTNKVHMKKTAIVKIDIKNSEKKKLKEILNITFFEIDNYNERVYNGSELKNFLNFHVYGSVIQLKYNSEQHLRRKEKLRKDKFLSIKKKVREKIEKMGKVEKMEKTEKKEKVEKIEKSEKEEKIEKEEKMEKKESDQKYEKKCNFFYPNKFLFMKRYSSLYRKTSRNRIRKRENLYDSISVNVQANNAKCYICNRFLYKRKNNKDELTKVHPFNCDQNVTNIYSEDGYVCKKRVLHKLLKCTYENLLKQNKCVLIKKSENAYCTNLPMYANDYKVENNECFNNYHHVNSHFGAKVEILKHEEQISGPVQDNSNVHEKIEYTLPSPLLENASPKNQIKVDNVELARNADSESNFSATFEKNRAQEEGVANEEEIAQEEGVANEEEIAQEEGVANEEEIAQEEGIAQEEEIANEEERAQEEGVAQEEEIAQEEEVAKEEMIEGNKATQEDEPMQSPSNTKDVKMMETENAKVIDEEIIGSCSHSFNHSFSRTFSPSSSLPGDKAANNDSLQNRKEEERDKMSIVSSKEKCMNGTKHKKSDEQQVEKSGNDVRRSIRLQHKLKRKIKVQKDILKGKNRVSEIRNRKEQFVKEGKNQSNAYNKKDTENTFSEVGLKDGQEEQKGTNEKDSAKKKKVGKQNICVTNDKYNNDKRRKGSNSSRTRSRSRSGSRSSSRRSDRGVDLGNCGKDHRGDEAYTIHNGGQRDQGVGKEGKDHSKKKISDIKKKNPNKKKDCTYDETPKGKNSKKLIFTMSLSDSTGESLNLENANGNRAVQGSIVRKEKDKRTKKIGEPLNTDAKYENKYEKYEDIKIAKENVQMLRENNVDHFDKPFADTYEIYMNERIEEDKIYSIYSKFKLVVIYLFDHYVIGGLYLINPYNSQEKKRYIHFARMQSNINNINHTKIFHYNSNELVGSLKKNSKILLLSDKNEKRVMKILSKRGNGINGSTYKCMINDKLLACKVQQKLHLAKKEIYFSYILKVRKSNKLYKYTKYSNINYSSKNFFFEIFKENRYIFPDELHYRMNKKKSGSSNPLQKSKYKNDIQNGGTQNSSNENGMSILLMNTYKYVISLNELINTYIKKNYKAISEEFILFIIYQIIVGVLQLHLLDVLHGDLKIDNILIVKNENMSNDDGTKDYNIRKKDRNDKNYKNDENGRNHINDKYDENRRNHINDEKDKSKAAKKKGKNNHCENPKEDGKQKYNYNNLFYNDKLKEDNKNAFLRNTFPLNLFLIDIGRGIDIKHFKKYIFYGEKNCDCYNFLTDSVYNYHIDLVGIAQVASCLLFYRHIGHVKYKYEDKIVDRNNIVINNLDITYVTHNNHFLKRNGSNGSTTNNKSKNNNNNNNNNSNSNNNNNKEEEEDQQEEKKKKKASDSTISKSKYQEIENFIKAKEQTYVENANTFDSNDKYYKGAINKGENGMCSSALDDVHADSGKKNCARDGSSTNGNSDSKCSSNSGSNSNNNSNSNSNGDNNSKGEKKCNYTTRSQTKMRRDQEQKQAQNKKQNYKTRKRSNDETDEEDENNSERVYYIDYSKFLSIDEKNKEKINSYFNEIKKQTDSYFVEKEEENKIKNFNVKMMLSRKKYQDFWQIFFHLLLNFCNVYELNYIHFNSNEKNKNSEKGNMSNNILINKSDNYYFNFDQNNWEEINSKNKNKVASIYFSQKRKYYNNSEKNYYGDTDLKKRNNESISNAYYSDSTNKAKGIIRSKEIGCCNGRGIDNDIRGGSYINRGIDISRANRDNGYPHNPHTTNDQRGNLRRECLKESLIMGENIGNNNKYFFIQNSISNLKSLKKTMHDNWINNGKSKMITNNKTDQNSNANKSDGRFKRKLLFFENEQNKTKCRKLNDANYYISECSSNDTKKSTKYINKLMKKKAIFILLNLKRAIEKIFDDDEEKQAILLREMYNASTLF
ncbi:conserved Plasmodium protein, unknown function [Plasmodium malariae]|uniref:Protein kinase domain-containing protein n=1 Tax=Plasmodium malariae TaxID=5858 RepID=A0A1C3KCA8_PLAMA|nr:conserved Plasmodium protein, unknown function [Plasmodium malariae]